MPKVFISPSNQIGNKYAGIDMDEYTNCSAIGHLLYECLTVAGFDVRIASDGVSMKRAVIESNYFKPDLHICIHTNAFDGKVFGTRVFRFANSGKAFDCGKVIYDGLCKLIPDGTNAYRRHSALYELKYTIAPAVYVEVDFHDVPDRAKWLVDNRERIAHNLASSICSYFGVSCPVSTTFNCPYCGHVLEVK